MTAIIAVRRGDGAYLMSDGAHYGPDGVVRQIAPKVLPFPQAPCALAFRGATELMRGMLSLTVEPITFDELLEILPVSARVAREFALGERFGAETKGEIIIAGWSEKRGGPIIGTMYTYSAHYRDPDGETLTAEPFTLIESSAPYIGTLPPDALAKEFGLSLPANADHFEPAMGVAWMQALRRWPGELGFNAVGGYVQLTSIGSAGLQSAIIHKWPDEVGQLINPA